MEVTQAVRSRRMCRRYDPDRGIPEETLTVLLELSGAAPSAGFSQGRDFVVLRDGSSLDDFWTISTRGRRGSNPWLEGMRQAPVLVLCLSDPDRYLDRYARPDKRGVREEAEDWPVPYWDVDTGMAVMLMLLGAEDAGLGACFFGVERETEDALRQRFSVPAALRFVGVLSLGFPAPARGPGDTPPAAAQPGPHRPVRRHVTDFAHDERFGRPWLPSA